MINFLVLISKYYDLFDPVLAISVQILIIYLNPGVPTSHTGPFTATVQPHGGSQLCLIDCAYIITTFQVREQIKGFNTLKQPN